jgi:hypothetical protein
MQRLEVSVRRSRVTCYLLQLTRLYIIVVNHRGLVGGRTNNYVHSPSSGL